MRKLLILGIALLGVGLFVAAHAAQSPMRTDVIRLHILANSDSDADQSEKMWVRDLVLKHWGERLANLGNAQSAWKQLGELAPQIQADIDQALKSDGVDYGVSVSTGVFAFPDRQYDGLDLPKGRYRALQVRLGDARGQNWWCVMFPPLCLVGVDENFDVEKYRQMIKDLQRQEDAASATSKETVRTSAGAAKSTVRSSARPAKETPSPRATATPAPQAPVRSWLVDEFGAAGQWDKSFMEWAKEFWLNGE